MQNLVDDKSLRKWQDKFCDIANVYAFYVDAEGQVVSEMSGCHADIERIRQVVSEESIRNIFRRVSESELEEQAVENTAVPNLRLAAVAVRIEGELAAVWIVAAVLFDSIEDEGYEQDLFTDFKYMISEKKLYMALDLLRHTATEILETKCVALDAEAESRRSRYSESEMSASLKRNAAITEIVQLLDSDSSIEAIMTDVLQIVGAYLDISIAIVCRMHRNNEVIDIIAQWCNVGIVPIFEKTQDQPIIDILKTDKVVVLSSGASLSMEEQEGENLLGVEALIIMPLVINGKVTLQACFGESRKKRKWEVEEVKFLNDITKILQSIITKRIQKNSLASSYASLETILDNVGSSIYVRDMQTKEVLFANRSLRNNFKIEIRQNTLDVLFEKDVDKSERRGKCEVYYEDRERWYDLYYTNITWVDGRAVVLFAIYDITEKKLYQKKIEQQAYTDFLTGLYNRMCCEKDLARYIDEAKKRKSSGAVLYLDLDDFKHINDGLGHQYGDLLLKSISHSLQRVEEIENSCYRVGGDEFVIIVPPNHYMKLESIVGEIKRIFAKPWFLKEADYYCTMSMGVVSFPAEGESVHELIKKADIAMYEAKKLGKNRVAFYSENINSASNKRLDMEKNMRDAAVGGCKEFEVYFQPIIDIQLPGTPCMGAEALVRWNSEELGFVSPADFIPLAEYLGLINPIGNHVLMESCKYCKEWNDNGCPDFKVNVNLSVIQLLQIDIVEVIAKALAQTGINPRNLTLEVTENLAINDMERMKLILGKIKKLGVRIALDDFGTGYSSLNYIREMPLDVLKVDQSFVRDLAEDAYSQSFIRMVAELAGAIDVSICVEGIETMEQYKVLEGMKVRLVQGYYFDRPMKRKDFEEKYVYNKKSN